MLPSSGAWQLRTKAPMPDRPTSAETAAMAVGPSPIPPHSSGMWGSHSPSDFARSRSLTMSRSQPLRSPPSADIFASAGRTSPSTKARTFDRTCSISGLNVKSIAMWLTVGREGRGVSGRRPRGFFALVTLRPDLALGGPNLPVVRDKTSSLPTGEEKRARVREMFDTIAPRYDLINRLMTFGLDRRWRKRTIKLLDLQSPCLIVDVGCGTGDLGRELLAQGHRAVGIDMSLGMLKARPADSAPVALADAAMLPLADATVDGAVSGFALRNFSELLTVIVELARVVRPGGRIALLDVAQPERRLLKAGYSVWFNHPLLSDEAAYRYLPQSVAYLPRYTELASMLGDAGFISMRRDLLSGGAVQVISATRSGTPRAARHQVVLAEGSA